MSYVFYQSHPIIRRNLFQPTKRTHTAYGLVATFDLEGDPIRGCLVRDGVGLAYSLHLTLQGLA